MSGQFVSKFKFVWDDADHALERWLEEMARQGLHLHKVDCLRSRFVFQRGEPAEMAYRLDFQVRRISQDHIQLFVDAGWEHVDHSFGWQFWRAPVRAGRTPEIFTDTASRIRKYQRLLWLFAATFLLYAFRLFDKGAAAWDTPTDIVLNLFVAVFILYAAGRLLLRIHRLRNPQP